MFETLRVAEHGGGRTAKGETGDGSDENIFGQEEEINDRRHVPAAASVMLEGEEERLLRAVDNGNPDL